jgi:hypothetical protein
MAQVGSQFSALSSQETMNIRHRIAPDLLCNMPIVPAVILVTLVWGSAHFLRAESRSSDNPQELLGVFELRKQFLLR